MTDHIHTDIRAFTPQFGYAERARHLVNGVKDKMGFLSFWKVKLVESLLEFPIRRLDDGKQVVDIWPGIMAAVVPIVGALLQGFIIPFFVLLDEAFQADISSNL
jgi:hypothetical protein